MTMYAFLVPPWQSLALDVTLKASLLVLAAGIAAGGLRRASAASRHQVWLLAFGGLLALPLLAAAMPGWQLSLSPRVLPAAWTPRVLPPALLANQPLAPARGTAMPSEHRSSPATGWPAAESTSAPRAARAGFAGPDRGFDSTGASLGVRQIAARPAPGVPSRPLSRREQAPLTKAAASFRTPELTPAGFNPGEPRSGGEPGAWALLLWLAGAALMAARSVVALMRLGRTFRRCRRVTAAPVVALAAHLARDLELPRPVMLIHGLIDGPPAVPMTWGFMRPIVLLPTGFAGWPEARQRAVLLHELAHVKRGDWLIQLLARGACVLYWFHPLVWWAARRLQIESEQACDDQVLTAGILASDYATHLLDIVRAARPFRISARAAVSMAQGPLIELRLRAILDPRRDRHATPRRAALLTTAAAIGLLPPLAAVRVSARTPSPPAPPATPASPNLPAGLAQVEIHDVTAPPAPSPTAPRSSFSGPPAPPLPLSPPVPTSPPPFPSALRAGPAGALAGVLPVRVQTPVLSPSVVLAVAPRSAVVARAVAVAARSAAVAHAAVAVAAKSAAVARVAVAVAGRVAAVVELAADAEPPDARSREPNLSDKDLSGVDLSGRDLSGKDLSGKNLSRANLVGTKLTNANLSGTDLSGANLANADLSHARMSHADLSGTNLSGARLVSIDLTGVSLSGANLSHAEMRDLTLVRADLAGCNLKGINLSGMNLSGTIFSGANLAGARLSGANLTKSDLAGANLATADLSHARLTNADLSGANLSGSKLDGADLKGADVSGTKLDQPKPDDQ